MQIHQFSDPEKLAQGAAEFICNIANACIHQSGHCSIVLSGGSTPEATYHQLVEISQAQELDWARMQIYWGDERCVPIDHVQSNYRMARQALFDHVSISDANLHRMTCTGNPEIGAERYEALLREHFAGQDYPQFDFILLGLGDDGHTASLFPNTSILEEQVRWVAPVYVPHLDSWRVSLTLPVINAARHVAFLVSGERKAAILEHILHPSAGTVYPAQRVAPQGTFSWLIDRDAGQRLRQ